MLFVRLFRKILAGIPSVKQFGSRSGPTFVGPGVAPNCLQRLSVDDTSR